VIADPDPVYRCTCSWVGGDPDLRPGKARSPTCPACWHHDKRRRVVTPECPKCQSTSHRCKTGACLHCDREACGHVWFPRRKTVRRAVRERAAPDLFREGSLTGCVLRFMIEQGEVSAKQFKAAHVGLGGTTNSTHAFDRYFVGKTRRWSGDSYVPRDGSHDILERIVAPGQRNNARNGRVRWVGSEGATFEERATAWFEKLTPAAIDRALAFLEAEVFAVDGRTDTEEMRQRALTWFRIASGASGRSAVRSAPDDASTVRDANEVHAQAA
jgi:hypothetical protein